MRILTEFEESLNVIKEYLSGHESYPWSQSQEALENTLKYIFALSHNCYVLLAKDGLKELCKFEFAQTSPLLKTKITQKLNKTIKGKKRQALLKTLKNNQWKIMQCVVKPFTETGGNPLYEKFFQTLNVPDGAYIFSLNDAQLLRQDGTLPWHMVSSAQNPYKPPFLPMFASSGQKGYYDIVIPNQDDIEIAMNPLSLSEIPWTSKKEIAVFRGGPTGCGLTPKTNMRLKLAQMRSPLLDVGIVSNKSKTLKFDPQDGLGYLETSIPKVEKLEMFGQQDYYKYIIHVDGNVLGYRLLKSMLTGSLILRVQSPFTHWLDDKLIPGKHYIAVKEDLSDLEDIIDWCIKNDSKSQKIAHQGFKIAQKYLDLKIQQKFMETEFKNLTKKL